MFQTNMFLSIVKFKNGLQNTCRFLFPGSDFCHNKVCILHLVHRSEVLKDKKLVNCLLFHFWYIQTSWKIVTYLYLFSVFPTFKNEKKYYLRAFHTKRTIWVTTTSFTIRFSLWMKTAMPTFYSTTEWHALVIPMK